MLWNFSAGVATNGTVLQAIPNQPLWCLKKCTGKASGTRRVAQSLSIDLLDFLPRSGIFVHRNEIDVYELIGPVSRLSLRKLSQWGLKAADTANANSGKDRQLPCLPF